MIYYSDKAKCLLMENDPNSSYEACFYNGMYSLCMCSVPCVSVVVVCKDYVSTCTGVIEVFSMNRDYDKMCTTCIH